MLLSLCVTSNVVMAKDTSSVTQYPVKGKTAQEVYADIRAHAPRVASNATFAFTMIATKTDKLERATAKNCKYSSFKTSAIYNFVIPRHSSPATLPAKTRSKWMSFVNYLKAHEAVHRSFWQKCLSDYDAQALTLSGKTCAALYAERETLLTTFKRSCLAQDEAFDVQFRRDVLKEPFVAEALRQRPEQSR
jgi:predicted secreted Zn-dependent protease